MKKFFVRLEIAIAILFGVVGIPYFLEYVIFRSDRYSAISNSDWASFLGGYIGAIIGAIGIVATLYFSKKENNRMIVATKEENDRMIVATKEENDRMLKKQCKPFIKYDYSEIGEGDYTHLMMKKPFAEIKIPGLEQRHYILFQNIGRHHAVNIDIVKYKCNRFKHKFEENIEFDKNKKYLFDILKVSGPETTKLSIPRITKDWELFLIIKYEDIQRNQYFDEISINDKKITIHKQLETSIRNLDDYKIFSA